MKHISGPHLGTTRYIINDEPMDTAKIDWPAHISQRDSGLGYGNRAWIIECGGTDIEAGVRAIQAVYPNARATGNRQQAARWCRQ